MYSIVDLEGSQGESNFGFSFQYLSEAHIHVYVDGEETEDFTFSTAFTITLDEALTADATVRIRRVTPIDEQMVDFSNGSVLGETDLDTSVLQVLFAQQELDDSNSDLAAMRVADGGTWDAQSIRIINLASPVDPTDAANKLYVDTQLAAFAAAEGITITAIDGIDPASVLNAGTLMVGDGGAPTQLTSLARGNNGDVLEVRTTEPTNLKWVTLAAKLFQLLTTKGDLLVANATTAQRLPIGTDQQVLIADSAEAAGVKWITPTSITAIANALTAVPVVPRSVNLRGLWTSNTTFNFTADVVVLAKADGAGVRRTACSGTCDITTAGPAANGRDQAGVFTANTYVHYYWIWNPTSETLATIASNTGPATGPTLPSGYTYWCYITTMSLNASTQLNKHMVMGNTVYRDPWDVMYQLCSKTTASEELFSSSTVLPTIAMSAQFEIDLAVSDAAAAAGDNCTVYIRAITGGASGWSMIVPATSQPMANNFVAHSHFSYNVPYLSGYYVQLSDSGTITSRTCTIVVSSYTVPNNS